MSRAALGRATSLVQLIAAGTLALVGVRFGGAGVLYAVRGHAPPLDSGKAVAPPRVSASASARPPAPSVTAPPVPTRGPSAKHGAPLRLSLIVNTHERVEVIVEGVTVGFSPYIGEVACKAGDKVKIDLLPPKGTPRRTEHLCAPGGIRIED
jgi:hypothetical protein